jgi:hypothetical protein
MVESENTPFIPLLKEGEISLLLPPVFIREDRGGISFVVIFFKRFIPITQSLERGECHFAFPLL